jgi:hypothetical protein
MTDQPEKPAANASDNTNSPDNNQNQTVGEGRAAQQTDENGWHAEEREHKRQERTYWRIQKIVSAVTLVLSLIAAGGAAAGAYIAFKAFKEAKRQADAAESQIAVAKDNAQRQLRAYIGFIPPTDNQVINNFAPPAKPVVRLTPHNFGQTPAYRAINWTGMGVLAYPLSKDFPYPTQKSPIGPNPITIHPGNFDIAGIVVSASQPLAQWDFDRIGDGKNWRLYAWGTVTYDDAFGQSHFTNFCIGFYGVTIQQAQREPCIDHNDSD